MATVTPREMAHLLVETLGLESVDPACIDPASALFGDGLGLDSLDMLELSLVIQQRFGVRLKAEDPHNERIFASLQSLAEHISTTRAASA